MNSHVRRIQQLWTDAKAPRAPDAPTVISTFAGCGGSSLGYAAAGFRELLAVEFDKHAIECLRLNFPGLPVWEHDIRELSAEHVLKTCRIKPGELDVLDGSPPCQGFSTAGKRQLDDKRNSLFVEFARLVDQLQPRCFVMENVTGMVKGRMRLIFRDALQALRSHGYGAEARILDARYFDVAQKRKRLFVIGSKRPFVGSLFPAPVRRQPPTFNLAVGDLLSTRDETMTTDAGRALWSQTNRGKSHEKRFSHVRCARTEPVPTIVKAACRDRNLMHPDIPRPLTVQEYKRLQTIPDEFAFPSDSSSSCIINRIGNSVPPMLMYHIAKHLRESVLARDTSSVEVAQ